MISSIPDDFMFFFSRKHRLRGFGGNVCARRKHCPLDIRYFLSLDFSHVCLSDEIL